MTEGRRGIVALIGAALIWGFSPLMWKSVAHVPSIEVMAHRTLWSLVFFALWLGLSRRLGEVKAAFASPRATALTLAAALFISINWFLFIWAVTSGQATEGSLGYYIYPLVAVLIGRIVFGERLAHTQMAAVALAALAVSLLTWGLGAAPWIALALSISFGIYGLLKKGLGLGPVVSVTAEVLLLTPVALWLLWQGSGPPGGYTAADIALLTLAGPVTATPLVLFSYAARRVRMATLGLVQYLNPTIQFFLAVSIFAEPFTRWHGVAFTLIWTALAIYSLAEISAERAQRRRASASAASSATSK